MPPVTASISLSGLADSDRARLAELTERLQSEVRELPVERVGPVPAGPPPPGAKAVDPMALGALVVSLAPEVIPRLLDMVKGWLDRQPDDTLKLKVVVGENSIEVEHSQRLSSKELAALAERLARTARGA
jgi:hypothetical protein